MHACVQAVRASCSLVALQHGTARPALRLPASSITWRLVHVVRDTALQAHCQCPMSRAGRHQLCVPYPARISSAYTVLLPPTTFRATHLTSSHTFSHFFLLHHSVALPASMPADVDSWGVIARTASSYSRCNGLQCA